MWCRPVTKVIINALCLFALSVFQVPISHSVAASQVFHVRLKDRLDRPVDGYCLDIVGTSASLQLDLPLFAHNCKRGATPDSAIQFTAAGELRFPAVEVCITAFGINRKALPGVPLLLRRCNSDTAFFNASQFQKFKHLANGQLRLHDHNLCLAVGEDSQPTFSAQDRWRVLTLEVCDLTKSVYSVWEMVSLR